MRVLISKDNNNYPPLLLALSAGKAGPLGTRTFGNVNVVKSYNRSAVWVQAKTANECH
jgi:hypothetical protein